MCAIKIYYLAGKRPLKIMTIRIRTSFFIPPFSFVYF